MARERFAGRLAVKDGNWQELAAGTGVEEDLKVGREGHRRRREEGGNEQVPGASGRKGTWSGEQMGDNQLLLFIPCVAR